MNDTKPLIAAAQARGLQAQTWSTTSRIGETVARDGQVERDGARAKETVSVEVIRDGRRGYVTQGGDYDPDDLLDLASVVSELSAPQDVPAPPAAGTVTVPYGDELPHTAFTSADLTRLSGYRRPGATLRCQVEMRATHESRTVATAHTDGTTRVYGTQLAGIICRVTAIGGRTVQLTQEYFAADAATLIDALATGALDEQLDHAERLATLERVHRPIRRVLLHSRLAGRLLTLANPAFGADAVAQGRSRFAAKLGTTVAAAPVTLVEDANAASAPLPRPWDDEGTPARPTTLIDRGVLRGYLVDRELATFGAPTGSAWRGDGGEAATIEIGYADLRVDAPPASFESAGGPGDLYVVQANGMHMSNDVTGDFSFTGSGFTVESDGREVALVDVPIAGNVFDLLMDIEGHNGTVSTWRSRSSFLSSPGLWVHGLTVGDAE